MGVSYYVFVGPFVEAPNAEIPIPRKYMGCGTTGCDYRKKESTEKFCPKCGNPIKQCEKTSVMRPSRDFDGYEELGDRLTRIHEENLPDDKQNVAVFQPNTGKFGQKFSAYDSSIVALNESIIADEMNRFNAFFAKDIARIGEVFGKVEVKWGVVAYAS